MSVSHTSKQAYLRTLVMLNEGRSPKFYITIVLSKSWFGVWDTDIILQPVFSINLISEVTSWALRQNQCTIDTLQSQS